MKKTVSFIGFLLVSIFLSSAIFAEKEMLLDGLMAKVNEHTITIGDVMSQVQPLQRELISKYKGEELRNETRKLFQKVLDNLIEDKLVLDAYKAQKGQIPEWVVDKRMNEILHEVFHDDRAAMMRALATENLSYKKWRTNIRNQIIVSSMRQANVQDRLKISSIDIQKYYKSHIADYQTPGMVRLEVMVLKNDGTSTKSEIAEKAKAIYTQLKNGSDFYQMAKKYSQGSKAEKGGDWGWLQPSDLREELRDAIAGLDEGGITDVINIDEDFYILKVFGIKPGTVKSFADAREEIEAKLRNKEGRRLNKEWIDSLKRNAQIEIMDIDPFADN